jgi:hypothetical protein
MGYLWICHQHCVFFSRCVWKWMKMEYTPPNGPFQKVRYCINYIFKKMRFPPLKPPKMSGSSRGPAQYLGWAPRCVVQVTQILHIKDGWEKLPI